MRWGEVEWRGGEGLLGFLGGLERGGRVSRGRRSKVMGSEFQCILGSGKD